MILLNLFCKSSGLLLITFTEINWDCAETLSKSSLLRRKRRTNIKKCSRNWQGLKPEHNVYQEINGVRINFKKVYDYGFATS